MPTTLDFSVTKVMGKIPSMISRMKLNDAVMELLGTITAPPVGVTLAIPANLNINGRPYGILTPDVQYRWLRDSYMPRGITPFFDCGIAVPEFHKSGSIHLHMICWNRDYIDNQYHERSIRAQVNNSMIAYTIHRGKSSNAVHLTFVHTIKDIPEWVNYMQKSQHDFEGSDLQPLMWVDDQSIDFYKKYPVPHLSRVPIQHEPRERRCATESSVYRCHKDEMRTDTEFTVKIN